MRVHTARTQIAAPPEAVFARMSDFEHAGQYIEAIRNVELLTPGPPAVGTRFRETRLVFGRESTETMEIVEFDPPRGYVLAAHSGGMRFLAEVRVTAAPGGSEVAMSLDLLPQTKMARIMSWLVFPLTKMMAKACAKDLEDIKASFEGAPARGSAPASA